MSHAEHAPADQAIGARLPALEGLRGMMTLLVVLSHFFGELPHGLRAVMFGWVAVDMFFVMSGYLIGKLILEKKDHANFFMVFYVRRCLRILPPYVLVTVIVWAMVEMPPPWTDTPVQFPLWSYLSFTQTFFMIDQASIGAHWLAPTWTLAVEEHFYLVIPAVLVFTPLRRLSGWLIGAGLVAIVLRAILAGTGPSAEYASLVLLPARADILVLGLLGAVAMVRGGVDWARWMIWLRASPLIALIATFALQMLAPTVFLVFSPTLVGAGCAGYLLAIVHGAPEAKVYHSPILRFLGANSYCIYLTHMPVLGLMHGGLLGAAPDLATPVQGLVSLAALPVALLVGWGMTKLVEEPAMLYGRRWRWSDRLVSHRPARLAQELS